MAKAIPPLTPRQAAASRSALSDWPADVVELTPESDYSLIHGVPFCHLTDSFVFPDPDGALPLLLRAETDYAPFLAAVQTYRGKLRRDLRRTISPMRRRSLRTHFELLGDLLFVFRGWVKSVAEVSAERGRSS